MQWLFVGAAALLVGAEVTAVGTKPLAASVFVLYLIFLFVYLPREGRGVGRGEVGRVLAFRRLSKRSR